MAGPSSVVGAPVAWTTGTLTEAGMRDDLVERIGFGVRSGLLPSLHGVTVARHGKLVAERYFKGPDETWGQNLGEVAHGPDTLHDLRSVTKSVVSLLYGIALAKGLVPPPSAPLYPSFPAYRDLAGDPKRQAITVAHALAMSLGTEWDETVPYSNEANSEIQMEKAQDRLRYILERPVTGQAGQRWVYSGGATALIGDLIARGAGRPLETFAREELFAPLGITTIEWAKGSDGVASAASGLRLAARDLLRIGQLILNRGRAGDNQVVPAEWIAASTRTHIATTEGPITYGYQWWLGETAVRADGFKTHPWIGAFGNGGQRLFVMPSLGITAALYFGNYNRPLHYIYPSRVFFEIVVPGVTRI